MLKKKKKKKEELKNEKEKPMKNEEELTFLQSIHGGSHLSLLYTAWKRRQYEMDMNKRSSPSLPIYPNNVATPPPLCPQQMEGTGHHSHRLIVLPRPFPTTNSLSFKVHSDRVGAGVRRADCLQCPAGGQRERQDKQIRESESDPLITFSCSSFFCFVQYLLIN